jgi:hypothetical protein
MELDAIEDPAVRLFLFACFYLTAITLLTLAATICVAAEPAVWFALVSPANMVLDLTGTNG